MADNAKGRVSASILLDSIKSKFTGSLDFTIGTALATSSGQGWIYAVKDVGTSSTDLLGTTEDYLGYATGAAAVDTADKVLWICIQHTGTTNGTTSTDEGIVLCLDGGTAAHNLVDGIFIDSGETMIFKAPNTTVANLHAISVNVSNALPSSDGDGTVRVKIAAVLLNMG